MTRWVWRGAALGILAALFAVTVYRALTQSITHDEAVTLRDFVAGPLSGWLIHYDANNHVLHSLMARVSISLFGQAEWALRLPALGAALLLFAAVFVLSRRLFGDTVWLPVSVAAITCNSYLLDFLPLARGYGLACALFLAALAFTAAEEPIRCTWAGIALGLSIAANLTMLIPVAALGVTLILRHGRAAVRCVMIAAVTCIAVIAAPMWNAHRDSFYYGAAQLWDWPASLVGGSVYHNVNDRSDRVTYGVAVVYTVLLATVLMGARDRKGPLHLLAGTIAGTGILTLVAHLAAKMPLPFGRTGLYWIPLFGLSAAMLAQRFPPAALAIALSLAACYNSWTTNAAADWEYDAGTRRLAENAVGMKKIAASWPLEPALNYYRRQLGLRQLEPIQRELDPRKCTDCDGFALSGDDLAIIKEKNLRVIYEDPVARSVLAASPLPPR